MEDCQDTKPTAEAAQAANGSAGYAEHAYNTEAEARLWEESCPMLGIQNVWTNLLQLYIPTMINISGARCHWSDPRQHVG